ncbi:uncharacterized protein LOC112589978 [Harpegnathos saltator]|uniref:uncharacterized protein LOC112589978 n=1 Tax=Harpegnathos saltator TaxID=610380 RepID=UPI000DBEE4EB|nr:uncharacterized protein LOC112589978 [Harpegnathos saltator]
MGADEIPNEVWKYGGEEVGRWAGDICRRVWRGKEWPEEWKEGIVVPIIKKGKGETVKEYRGVTLMPSLYKVYAKVLAERLKEELEGKRLLTGNQAGFREGMGTIDQIYALNYLINRQTLCCMSCLTIIEIFHLITSIIYHIKNIDNMKISNSSCA